MKYQEILVEKVIGNLAVGYHRTKSRDAVNAIVSDGFITGTGDTYGPGVYMTYDIKSQMNRRMIDNYGDYLIRNKVILANYLIFDEDVAKLVYKNDWQIEKQLKRFRFKPEEIKVILNKNAWTAIGEEYEVEYTSDYAHRVYQFKNKNIAGLVFTGRHDGKVIVAYKLSSLRPFGVANAPDRYSDIVWEKISNALVVSDEHDVDYNKMLQRAKKPNDRLRVLAQEQIDLEKVLNNYRMIKHINNPTEKVLLAVVKNDPLYLLVIFGQQFIDNLSEDFKLKAMKISQGTAIQMFKYPSEEVKLAAVQTNGNAIRYIYNPSTQVQLAALKQDLNSAEYFRNWSNEAYEYFVKENLKSNGYTLLLKNGTWEVSKENDIFYTSTDLQDVENWMNGKWNDDDSDRW